MNLNKWNYPKEVSDEFEIAWGLRNSGNDEKAIMKLLSLAEKYPNNPAFYGIIADIYWDMKDVKKAIEYFRKAVCVKPDSELASLGLFHTLWEKGEKEEALEEMKRYLSHYSSKKYDKILKGIVKEID